jgi:hypothetical protein
MQRLRRAPVSAADACAERHLRNWARLTRRENGVRSRCRGVENPSPSTATIPVVDVITVTTADLLEAWREATRAAELAKRLAKLAADTAARADIRADAAEELRRDGEEGG